MEKNKLNEKELGKVTGGGSGDNDPCLYRRSHVATEESQLQNGLSLDFLNNGEKKKPLEDEELNKVTGGAGKVGDPGWYKVIYQKPRSEELHYLEKQYYLGSLSIRAQIEIWATQHSYTIVDIIYLS